MGFGCLKYSDLKTESINFNNVGVYLVFLIVVRNQKDVSIVSLENQKLNFFLTLGQNNFGNKIPLMSESSKRVVAILLVV